MSTRHLNTIVLTLAIILVLPAAQGAEFEWRPVAASGPHDPPVGTGITLYGGGQSVTLELWMSDWAPDLTTTYQATVNGGTYSSGSGLPLGPLNGCCPGDPADAFIDTLDPDFVFGDLPVGSMALPSVNILTLNYQFACTILGGASVADDGGWYYGATLILDVPVGAWGTYTIGFVEAPTSTFLNDHQGFPITPLNLTSAVITVRCVDNSDCDDGNACTVDSCSGGDCVFSNAPPGTPCGDDTDTECTDPDTCDGAGVCLDNHAPNGSPCDDGLWCNVDEECIDGACGGGGPRDCSDGLDCTDDLCKERFDICENNLQAGYCLIDEACYTDGELNPANDCEECDTSLSTLEWSPLPVDTACGDQSTTDCSDPDACDGAGTCLPNHLPPFTPCGDGSDTDCTDPDTCLMGVCQDNHEPDGTSCTDDGIECTDDVCASGICTHPDEPPGTPCGDPTDTDCDHADTCDGAGWCDDNVEPDDTPCTDDGNECTDDVCLSGSCEHPDKPVGAACGDPSDTDCTDPDSCDGAGTCLDNHEIDGTICTDDGNDCTDDVCDNGACTHPDKPVGAACGDDSDTDCTDPDTCDGAGSCLDNHEPVGTACGDPFDGDCDNPDTCDGAGTCEDNLEPDGTVCTDDGNDCTDDVCDAGGCTHPDKPVGAACGDDSDTDCTDPDSCDGAGFCEDNHASLGDPCGDQGIDCLTDDTCDGSGSCTDNGYWADGTSCGDTSDTECTDPDTCLAGACQGNHASLGDPCGDQGIDCLTDDTCDGSGLCTDNGYWADGTSCGDTSDTECTDPDTCLAGACQDNHASLGDPCGDQGLDCLTDDTCDGSGSCTDNGYWADGTSCGDTSDTECTDPDTCLAGACQDNHASLGDPCGDQGIECLTDDTCDGSGSCTDNGYWADGTSCGDTSDTECTDPDTCLAGACQDNHASLGDPCGDQGIDCLTDDTCDGSGSCTDNGYWADGMSCGDTSDTECTDPDTCLAGACQDNHAPQGAPCGDQGVDCLNDDTCDGFGLCQDNGHWPPDTSCGDPSDTDCTNPDTCVYGACLANHEPDGTTCTDDGNDCTNDVCASGGCTHPDKPVGTACGDDTDTDCDNPDTCDGAGGCQINHEPDGTTCTEDGNDCTDDVCLSGGCTHPNEEVGTACGDGADTDCTDPDTCDGSGSCQDNHEPDGTTCTDDGNDCTDDVCATGGCTHPNKEVGAACGVGLDTDCTDPDTCDGEGTCLDNHEPPGTACGDPTDTPCDNPDTCNGTGACEDNLEPDETPCDDDLWCNGTDLCVTGECEHFDPPCTGPCDEENDVCLCDAPVVEAAGSRYLAVSMRPEGSATPQAIVVKADCPEGAARYVGAVEPFLIEGPTGPVVNAGILKDDPAEALFLTAAQWGDPVYVTGVYIAPETGFLVYADCGSVGSPALSDAALAVTWLFAEIERDFVLNFTDIQFMIMAFETNYDTPATLANADVEGEDCLPNRVVNFSDIQLAILDFEGGSYGCPMECPVPPAP